VRREIGALGIVTRSEIDWLAEAEACDLALPEIIPDGIAKHVAAKFDDRGIDAVLQTTEHRRKRLLVADMDSTIITVECLDELADAVGLKPKIAAITERAMRGEIAFEGALIERVGLLKGLPESELARVMESRVQLTSGAKTLVQTMTRHGARCVLVSGGFTYFTAHVAQLAGFQHSQGNTLDIEDGKLTGRVVPPILGQDAKLEALTNEAHALGISLDATMAAGDGANDLKMLKAAGLGIAFHAKPKVAAEASAVIAHNDLTALLYLQGYRKTEFVG
jgi:phosphoserine phosphatase